MQRFYEEYSKKVNYRKHGGREYFPILVIGDYFLLVNRIFLSFDRFFLQFLLRLLSCRDKSSVKASMGEVLRVE